LGNASQAALIARWASGNVDNGYTDTSSAVLAGLYVLATAPLDDSTHCPWIRFLMTFMIFSLKIRIPVNLLYSDTDHLSDDITIINILYNYTYGYTDRMLALQSNW
jgi:hypothetical protein